MAGGAGDAETARVEGAIVALGTQTFGSAPTRLDILFHVPCCFLTNLHQFFHKVQQVYWQSLLMKLNKHLLIFLLTLHFRISWVKSDSENDLNIFLNYYLLVYLDLKYQ